MVMLYEDRMQRWECATAADDAYPTDFGSSMAPSECASNCLTEELTADEDDLILWHAFVPIYIIYDIYCKSISLFCSFGFCFLCSAQYLDEMD